MPDVVFGLTGDVRRNSRALKQLRVLARHGLQVDVLTLGPPAPDAWLQDGIRLHVLPTPPGSGPRFFWRIHRLFLRHARQIQADVYHASDLYTLPAMADAARRHDARLVYDARECYPHVASAAGRPWVRHVWQALEGRYIRRADAVFTVSRSIARHLHETYGIDEPDVLYNVPERTTVDPSTRLRDQIGLSAEPVLILHQGQMRADRGCLALVEAMAHVDGAVLVFLGSGPLRDVLLRRAEALGLGDRVHVLDAVPPDELLAYTASADIGVTLLEDTCLNHRYALPNKLFEYLMAGLPVLASDLPELRGVVQRYDVGCTADPAAPQQLASTLQRMVDDPEARARWASRAPDVLEAFSWADAAQRLAGAYAALLPAPHASTTPPGASGHARP